MLDGHTAMKIDKRTVRALVGAAAVVVVGFIYWHVMLWLMNKGIF
jgi:hypothetical protein